VLADGTKDACELARALPLAGGERASVSSERDSEQPLWKQDAVGNRSHSKGVNNFSLPFRTLLALEKEVACRILSYFNGQMRTRALAWCCIFGGILSTCYIEWARYLMTHMVELDLSNPQWPPPRPWPYPDRWLISWERRLEAEHPLPPGGRGVKIEGEWPRVYGNLSLGMGASAGVAVAGFVLLYLKQRSQRK